MAGGARLRVRIDVEKVRSNMQMQGRKLTEGDIEAWLRVVGFEVVGFEPGQDAGAAGGAALTCLTDPENLRCLDPSEVLDVTPVS
jgi:hypothetical protein